MLCTYIPAECVASWTGGISCDRRWGSKRDTRASHRLSNQLYGRSLPETDNSNSRANGLCCQERANLSLSHSPSFVSLSVPISYSAFFYISSPSSVSISLSSSPAARRLLFPPPPPAPSRSHGQRARLLKPLQLPRPERRSPKRRSVPRRLQGVLPLHSKRD